MNLTFKPTFAWLAAASLALCSYSCQPEKVEETQNAEVKGETNWDEVDLEKNFSVIRIINIPELCTDCQENEVCNANCEEGLTGMNVLQIAVKGILPPMPPIPCEPPPPGLYYPNYMAAYNPEQLDVLPTELYELDGKQLEVNVEEFAGKYIEKISGNALMGMGVVAMCWPPPPPPPTLESELSSLYLELPYEVDQQTLGMVFANNRLYAIATPENAVWQEENSISTIPFKTVDGDFSEIEGPFTIVVRQNLTSEKGNKTLVEYRYTHERQ